MRLNYRKYGNGSPLIILHGLYGSSDNWISIGKVLSSHFQVFILDQRNHGHSPHSMNHTYKAMREDLREFMDDHKIKKATLIGHSMGGKTAMLFASTYPHRVNNLIVIDIAPKNYSSTSLYSQQTQQHRDIISTMMNFNLKGLHNRTEINNILSRHIHSDRIRQFILKNLKRKSDKEFDWKLNIYAINQNLTEIMDGIETKLLTQPLTAFPVLFIRGDNSNYILDEDSNLIYTVFPQAKIVTIQNTTHWIHSEKPKQLANTIKQFTLYPFKQTIEENKTKS